ncbi:pentapeptide repeat-containing protein [Rhodococcus sp. ARC_M8]|uniref:pentapeptide repeat-containing protein n=1 Tax=Rhodococcus sp. ARC_M8 TaxID=2928853 RepID=UPI001FB49D4B|nr:pentapeptide repeat-containing protein [Rhodococcus sp. ARC_M8]MCJ0949942.1 pentapeptide repeat-containing protein [Rhodococcus sp. ARC_M8]
MTTSDASSGDSAVDESLVPSSSPVSRRPGIGFLAGTALAAVSIALFIVSGFAILSGDSGVAQPVATVLGGAGVLGAGVLTFRSAHNTRISAEKTAADQLAHAATELEHAQSVAAEEKARHERQFEDQRQQAELSRAEQAKTFERTYQREVIRDLRSRYTTCAEQLAHESAAIRLAGVYALASLADDWQLQNERDEKQVVIDLLRGYLRTPNTHTPALKASKLPDTGELEVRKTIFLTLHKRSTVESSEPKSWKGFDCTPTNADMSNADLSSSDLTAANLSTVNLSGANLNHAKLASADLTGVKLTDANLIYANLTGADLSYTNLNGAELYFAALAGANLTYAGLVGADLSYAGLVGARLTRTNLSKADLTEADLSKADLSAANLSDADLSDANLSDANLTSADLTGANLTSADLTEATVVSATLTNANLSKTNLSGANLYGADLTGATVDGATMVNIYYAPTTIWPDGMDQPVSRERP